MGVGAKIKGFFKKVGRGIKRAALWTWDKAKRIGKGIWRGVKWVARNVLPAASRVTTAITGGTGAVGAAARAAGAIGEVIGGKAGSAIQQGAGKVEHATQKVEEKTNQINNTVQDKGGKIIRIGREAANNVRASLRNSRAAG